MDMDLGDTVQRVSSPHGGWRLPPTLPHMSPLQKRVLMVARPGEEDELIFQAEGMVRTRLEKQSMSRGWG